MRWSGNYTDVLNVHDHLDPTAIPERYRQRPDRRTTQEGHVHEYKGLRIGVPIECFPAELSDEALRPLRRAIRILRERLDAEVVSVSIPSTTQALSAYYTIASAEASSNLARYDGVRYGSRDEEGSDHTATRSKAFGEEVQRRLILGTYALSAE